MGKGSTKRRPSNRPGSSELRRRRRIRWVLGVWVLLIFIAAIAYAIKKQLDGSPTPHGRSAQPTGL